MVPVKFLAILSLLLVVSACLTTDKEIITESVFIEEQIQIQPAPRGVDLNNVQFKVITSENISEVLEEWVTTSGENWAFYALSVDDYENLALNVAELSRYIKQQKDIIVFYENSLTD